MENGTRNGRHDPRQRRRAHARTSSRVSCLVQALREELGLTGTHVGCDTSSCGACTVLLDGVSVKSCTMFAVQADGRSVTTIEGIGTREDLHPMQEAFWTEHGLQCGFCTPGMIMSALDLIDAQSRPDRRTDPLGHRRQYLPLHRLRKHRQGRDGRGGRGARRMIPVAFRLRSARATWPTRCGCSANMATMRSCSPADTA